MVNRRARRTKDSRSSTGSKPAGHDLNLREYVTESPQAVARRAEVWSVALGACRVYAMERLHRKWYMVALRRVMPWASYMKLIRWRVGARQHDDDVIRQEPKAGGTYD